MMLSDTEVLCRRYEWLPSFEFRFFRRGVTKGYTLLEYNAAPMGNKIPTFRGTVFFSSSRLKIFQKNGIFFYCLPRVNRIISYDFYFSYFYVSFLRHEISYLGINVNFENTYQNILMSPKLFLLSHAAKRLTDLKSCSRLCSLGSLMWQMRQYLKKRLAFCYHILKWFIYDD